ncbi:hypothetical protein DM860_006349 [Cuscuta australis]|uniref:Uncharacterized protein n=1 Tax=Cuscuta australis TaxID=267555 RepID=A0A328D7F3_9ASTE|nr:hypothetical protein DM860_006349 [Cuscuta australis]
MLLSSSASNFNKSKPSAAAEEILGSEGESPSRRASRSPPPSGVVTRAQPQIRSEQAAVCCSHRTAAAPKSRVKKGHPTSVDSPAFCVYLVARLCRLPSPSRLCCRPDLLLKTVKESSYICVPA